MRCDPAQRASRSLRSGIQRRRWPLQMFWRRTRRGLASVRACLGATPSTGLLPVGVSAIGLQKGICHSVGDRVARVPAKPHVSENSKRASHVVRNIKNNEHGMHKHDVRLSVGGTGESGPAVGRDRPVAESPSLSRQAAPLGRPRLPTQQPMKQQPPPVVRSVSPGIALKSPTAATHPVSPHSPRSPHSPASATNRPDKRTTVPHSPSAAAERPAKPTAWYRSAALAILSRCSPSRTSEVDGLLRRCRGRLPRPFKKK